MAVLVLSVLGCSGASPSPGSGAGPQTPVTSTEPDPGVVIALDDFAALNLLSLGITADVAYDAFGYATTAALYAEFGVKPKPYGAALDLEEIAAAKPDVIVGVSLPTTVQQQAGLERLATTAILDYSADWRTALDETAKAVGREERAERIEALIDENSDTLAKDLETAGEAGKPISVIAGSTETFFSPPVGTNLGSLLAGVGLDRPAPQRAEVSATAPFVNISAENLTANDGSALYLMKGRSYPIDKIITSPLYPKLRAVQAKRAFEVSGEMWFGSSPLSVLWVLDDLRATLLEGGRPSAEDSVGDRLRQLSETTG